MKVKIDMELERLLRIVVLLDQHRTNCAERASDDEPDNPSPRSRRWLAEEAESRQLKEELLKAIERPAGCV